MSGVRGALGRRVVAEAAIVLAGSLLLVLAITWPLVLNLSTETLGSGSGGDRSGYVWDVWFSSEHGLRLWGTTVQEQIGAPFGRVQPASVNALQFAFLGPAWLVSQFTGPILAVNVSLLLGMTLGPAAMYLLIRWLGLGIAAAAWAGVAFAVFPNALIRATAHYPLALLACFPLLLLALWRWSERPDRRRAVCLAAATAFCWLTNPYYGTMAFVIVGVGGAVVLIRVIRSSGARDAAVRAGEVALAQFVLVLLPLIALFYSARSAVEDTLSRSRAELDVYGARISDYLLPDAFQESFGWLAGEERWAGLGAPGGERADFVGYLTLALAAVGVVVAIRGWSGLSGRLRAALLSAGPLIAVLVWFSLATPTRWFGVTIPTPSDVIYEVAPFLRVYARFAVPVTAILICVAAVGLAAIVRRSVVAAAFVVPLAIIASALELPPGGGLPLQSDVPVLLGGRLPADVPMWAWLRDEAPGDAEVYAFPAYPDEQLERFHMFGQLVHGRTIANGDPQLTGVGTDMTSAYADPRVPGAAGALSTLGIDLVTVSPDLYASVAVNPPAAASPPPGFTVVRAFPDGSAVWRVAAPRSDGLAIFQRSSWWPPERFEGRPWRYMRETARVTIFAPRAGRHRVTFEARNAAVGQRALRIDLPGDGSQEITVGARRTVTLDLSLQEGRNDVRLTNLGAPARPVAPGDPRVVSVQVSPWTVERRP